MGYLLRQLLDRQSEGRPLRVGLVGAGRFGTTVAATLGQMPGVRLFAVADLDRVRGLAALQAAGWREEDLGQGRASDAVVAGRPVLTDDATALATLPLDVLVEATGQPDVAATVIPAALGAGLHVVNVDVEADVLLGATFRRLADAAGKVYTLADGDQPACIVRLVDWARSLGYRIIETLAPGRLGRSFRWLLAAAIINNAGDGVALAAGPLLVASQTRDPLLVSMALLSEYLPVLLFGVIAGAVADRFDRRRMGRPREPGPSGCARCAGGDDRQRNGQYRTRPRGAVPSLAPLRHSPTRPAAR